MALTKRGPSAVEWLRRLEKRQISAVELMDLVISRVEEVNPKLNAMVTFQDTEYLKKQAASSDKERATGIFKPLQGLPVSIKDSIDVRGLRSTGGTHARKDCVPTEDATVVSRLRAAGAILIGKTNLPEYSSSYETDNALFGRTNNPFDLDRTPGGSSGGEAALLGADATLVGIGADGGGSIRVPSHYCGTVGLRPTVGLVPDTGHWPYTRDTGYRDMMCIGPMARYVEDLALILPVIAGRDSSDPYAFNSELGAIDSISIANLNVGFFLYDGRTGVSPETQNAILDCTNFSEKMGASVVEVALPDISDATTLFFTLIGADGGKRTRIDLEGSGARHHVQFQTLLEGFNEALTVTEFFDLQKRFFEFRSKMRTFLSKFDVVICPVTPGPAPLHMTPPFGFAQESYYEYQAFNYVHAFAIAGAPCTVVPVSEQDNLPIGVQVVSSPCQEHMSLYVARQLEHMLSGFAPTLNLSV